MSSIPSSRSLNSQPSKNKGTGQPKREEGTPPVNQESTPRTNQGYQTPPPWQPLLAPPQLGDPNAHRLGSINSSCYNRGLQEFPLPSPQSGDNEVPQDLPPIRLLPLGRPLPLPPQLVNFLLPSGNPYATPQGHPERSHNSSHDRPAVYLSAEGARQMPN